MATSKLDSSISGRVGGAMAGGTGGGATGTRVVSVGSRDRWLLNGRCKINKCSEVLKVTSVSESLTGSVSQSVSEAVTKGGGEL